MLQHERLLIFNMYTVFCYPKPFIMKFYKQFFEISSIYLNGFRQLTRKILSLGKEQMVFFATYPLFIIRISLPSIFNQKYLFEKITYFSILLPNLSYFLKFQVSLFSLTFSCKFSYIHDFCLTTQNYLLFYFFFHIKLMLNSLGLVPLTGHSS